MMLDYMQKYRISSNTRIHRRGGHGISVAHVWLLDSVRVYDNKILVHRRRQHYPRRNGSIPAVTTVASANNLPEPAASDANGQYKWGSTTGEVVHCVDFHDPDALIGR